MRGNILTPKMMCNKLFTIIDAIKEAAEKGEVLYSLNLYYFVLLIFLLK